LNKYRLAVWLSW